jgi:TRAP-type C4-dicarboxylate transport system permease large subunit
MLLGIILILVIIGMGVFLFIYKPPTAVVLPVAAALIAVIAFMPSFLQGSFAEPLNAIFGTVLSDGFTRLAPLIVAAILGAVLAAQVDEAGIARHLVRFSAEFAGDSPFLLTLLLTLVIALLFTNLGGLGAVIMVATTALPLMLAMGMQPLTAGAVFLLALWAVASTP